MQKFGHRIARHQSPVLCRGCVYLVAAPGKARRDHFNCEASGKHTFPTRTACTLWAKA